MSTPHNGSRPDETIEPYWILILGLLVALGFYAFWTAAHTQIATGYSWIRIVEFGVFVVSRTLWGALAGAVLLGAAAALRALKPEATSVRWIAVAGGYLLVDGLLSLLTKGPLGAIAGVPLILAGAVMMALRIRKELGRGVLYVGGLVVVGRLVGGIFTSWFRFFVGSNPAFIELSHMAQSSIAANIFLLVAINVPVAIWIMRKSLDSNPTNHKHFGKPRDYTLHTFTDEQSKHYPHLKLFRKVDLTSQSINVGKYRMADTEKAFAIKHKLLDRGAKPGEYRINRDRAAALFRAQMGPLWRTPKHLTKWEAAVLAIVLPRIAALDSKMSERDYKAAMADTERMLATFWKCAGDSYNKETDRIDLDMSEAVVVLRKYWNAPTVRGYFKRHAYVYTLIYAMLTDARRLGVLPPSEFRWLRVADRRLWLVVDNVGRITAFTEVAGIYSHFLHESKRKRALEKPAIDSAVTGLIEGVESYKFTEEELEKIEAQLKEQEQLSAVDPAAVAVKRQTLALGLLTVRSDTQTDFIEAALMNERGDIVHSQLCKPQVSVEEITAQHGTTDEQLARIVQAPTSMEARRKLLELVNGHDVIVFYANDVALIPGLERSAASVRVLEDPDEPLDLPSTSVVEGVMKQPPELRDAKAIATLVRAIWLKYREAEMRAQAQSEAGKAKPGN
ncbi:hypothetical protein [Ralstonia sp. ASV6]|uniref:secretion/conjugation apparatus DotM-related subunit n=1 Tax=Ralstonia sp. ASV6 TaxID=2795124 RepID=UPI0018EDDCE0|nr:hypothetical protein [Ralstonia sp. ASV6]